MERNSKESMPVACAYSPLQTTLDSRQSITPPVESYTGPAALATNLLPRLARDNASTPNKRIQDDFLELDFWPACAEPLRREARFSLIGLPRGSPSSTRN